MTVTGVGSLSPAADRSSSLDLENLDALWRAANNLAVGQDAPDIRNWSWSS
jgi:phosphoketolase